MREQTVVSFHVVASQGTGVNRALRGFQGRMAQLAQSQAMGLFWAMVILTNSVYLGVQLEWTAQHREDKSMAHIFATIHIASGSWRCE